MRGKAKSIRGRSVSLSRESIFSVGRSSSQSSKPSSSHATVSAPRVTSLPTQYPPHTQNSVPPAQNPVRQAAPPPVQTPAAQPAPVQIHHAPPPPVQIPAAQPPPVQNPAPQPPPVHIHDGHAPPAENLAAPEPNIQQQYQVMLEDLMALPGREDLPRLNTTRIANMNTTWFNRDKGKLTRVIAGIFRRKFDGPYYSWKVTPPYIRERYFRTFAQKYNWNSDITELVREGFLKISKKRMKGIVSQVKTSGERPPWIVSALWEQMCVHWATPEATERSNIASLSRRSDREGLGPHKHLSGQNLHVQQDMEKELGRQVTLGEVFIKTHTRADGTFVDLRDKQVADTYEKKVEETISQMDVDSFGASEQLTLTAEEKNQMFLQSTYTDNKGNRFGLGRLREIVEEGEENEGYSTTTSMIEMHEQLEAAQLKLANYEAENAPRDEEQRLAQSRLSSLENLVAYLQMHPEFSAYMPSQSPSTSTVPATTPLPTTGNRSSVSLSPQN